MCPSEQQFEYSCYRRTDYVLRTCVFKMKVPYIKLFVHASRQSSTPLCRRVSSSSGPFWDAITLYCFPFSVVKYLRTRTSDLVNKTNFIGPIINRKKFNDPTYIGGHIRCRSSFSIKREFYNIKFLLICASIFDALDQLVCRLFPWAHGPLLGYSINFPFCLLFFNSPDVTFHKSIQL